MKQSNHFRMTARDFFSTVAILRTLGICFVFFVMGVLVDVIEEYAISDAKMLQVFSKAMILAVGLCLITIVIQATGHGLLERQRVKPAQVGFLERHFGKLFFMFLGLLLLLVFNLLFS